MRRRNIIQTTVDDFAKRARFTKQSGAWYLRQEETIAVVELQKSQYGQQYFVNVALWLLPIADVQFPKERSCHIRTRWTRLFPDLADQVDTLLDLDAPLSDEDRSAQLDSLLESSLLPLLRRCSTISGLRSEEGRAIRESSLVTGTAQQLLTTVPK